MFTWKNLLSLINFLLDIIKMDKTLEALIIKKTVKALPTKISRRKYLKTLGINYNVRANSFEKISGGAADIEYEDLICPITQCIFIQPVVAADGFTYEKSSLDRLDMYPIRTSSGVVLEHRNYMPNMILRNMIYNLLSQMRRRPTSAGLRATNRVLNSEVNDFFEANWNYDLARELGIENFTIPALIPDMARQLLIETQTDSTLYQRVRDVRERLRRRFRTAAAGARQDLQQDLHGSAVLLIFCFLVDIFLRRLLRRASDMIDLDEADNN